MMRRAALESTRAFAVTSSTIYFPLFSITQRATTSSLNLILTDNTINGVRFMSGFRPVSRRSWNRDQETSRDQKKDFQSEKFEEFDRPERRPPRPNGSSVSQNGFSDYQPRFQRDSALHQNDAPRRIWNRNEDSSHFQSERFFEFNRPERRSGETRRPSGNSVSQDSFSDDQPAPPRSSWPKGRNSLTSSELDSSPSKSLRQKAESARNGSTDPKSESQKKTETQKSNNKNERPTKTAWDLVCELRNKATEEARSENSQQKSEDEQTSLSDQKSQVQKSQSRLDRRKNAANRTDLDSKGFKTYSHVVPQWDKMTSADVITCLKKSIIYNENDIVALNKPYGLPVHGGPSVHHSVARYLPDLAAGLDKSGKLETLFMVNRIDKETTGVLLLARTQKTAAKLNDLFVKRIIKKFYWTLTKNVPSPQKGIIDIPVGDSNATGTYRRVLRPDRTPASSLIMTKKSRLEGTRAVTAYTVLGSKGDCALVELSPTTGVKHQVRIHLAHGLNCPILGDHKYSHFTKLAPQRLPMSILKKLQIRQEKVRTLPMHLHARAIVIPEFASIGNIRISAELPKFFQQTMSKLKVKENRFD